MGSDRGQRTLPDAEARQRIREDLDASLFVEAAAGTGKTSALVSRIVAMLRSGKAQLERIVAVTFTEKAAGEMKLRLRAEIEKYRSDTQLPKDQRERLDTALEHLELARIGTIHAFCGDLLHERPIEAGVDPLFEVASEDEAQSLLDSAFDSWFEQTLADPPEGIRRVLRRRPTRRGQDQPRMMLRNAVRSLTEHRDFGAPWRRDTFERESGIDGVLEQLSTVGILAERAANPGQYLPKSVAAISRFVNEIRMREQERTRDYDGLEALLRAFARERHWSWRGRAGAQFGGGLSVDEVRDLRDRAKAELDRVLASCDAQIAPLLREELQPVIEAYETRKGRSGKLDFLDLLLHTRNLVRDNAPVRREFQQRFTHFFVDEFQDTDPLQAEILLLLAADDAEETDWRNTRPEPGKLFIVGDPKQSIYRFRRADVAVYEQVKRQLADRGAAILQLSASFRSLPSLQTMVNAAFAPVMRGSEDGSQAEYVPLQPVRDEVAGRPSLVVVPAPRPYGDYRSMVKWKIEESLPDAVGAFLEWLVRESGWTIEAPAQPGVTIPVKPRHICILLRRFQSFGKDITRGYVRALEARRLPHVLAGGRSFHEREEVLAIRNALTAIEWPEDELRVFATLRGPLFALGDDLLLAFRSSHRNLYSLRWIDEGRRQTLDDGDREVADALAVLGRLHVGRNRRPIADTIRRLLEAARAHAGIAIWPTGEQALANCLRTVDLARRYERRGAPSFRGFVEYLEQEAERGRSEDAPVVEEGTEGVRIMTVHKAKGLEFPVVVLADPTCNAIGAAPSRHVVPERGLWAEPLCGCVPPDLRDAEAEEQQRDRDEAARLAYVAATRARDLLVVPGVGDLRTEDELAVGGWLETLNGTIYPRQQTRRSSQPASGCPVFGDDSVFERPGTCRAGKEQSVQPGLHRPQVGNHRSVWWDPASLRLDLQEEVGLRQQRILVADEGEAAATESSRKHAEWQDDRTRALNAASTPSLEVETVTALASAVPTGTLDAPKPQVEEIAVDRASRPAGRRFGTLVHATLASVSLDADAGQVRDASRVQGRLVGAAEEEVKAASELVATALAHPLLRRAAEAAKSGHLRREAPVLLETADGNLVEGVVDLAFAEKTEQGRFWTVVDFKTDREIGQQRSRYESQVQLYVQAVSTATGEPASGVLLVL